MKSQATTDIAN